MTISDARLLQGSRKYIVSTLAFFLTLTVSFIPTVAHADTAWRYWSYWTSDNGTWQQALTGAADIEAIDGSVQGWRYITAGLEVGDELAPRISPNFAEICEGVDSSTTTARVAVVIDFGDASDYSDSIEVPDPISECVVVAAGSPSSLLLPDIVQLREESGLICAINDIPASGCGEEVEISTDRPTLIATPTENEQSFALFENQLLIAVGVLIVASTVFLIIKKRN